jgi:hypothetical protein
MKFLKNILFLSAVFVAAASFSCAEDGPLCDRSFVDVEVSQVAQPENLSALHKLMFVAPGQQLFVENWPTNESVDFNIQIIQSHIDTVFAPFIAEIPEEKEFISDVASLLKKHLVVIFRNSSRLLLKQAVNEFVGGDTSKEEIILGDCVAAECVASRVALKNVWNVAVEDVLAVLKKNKPSYDSAKFEALLRVLIGRISAQMTGEEAEDIFEIDQSEALLVLMDFKQNVLSYFSDEDLISIQQGIQGVDSIVDASSIPSIRGRGEDLSLNKPSYFSDFAAYDFRSNILYTQLPIVRDDSLEAQYGFNIIPCYDADGKTIGLSIPSSVIVDDSVFSSEYSTCKKSPRVIAICSKVVFAAESESSQKSNENDFDESFESVESV